MSGKWFANRGQVIQTFAAIISACATVAAFLLRNANYLPTVLSWAMYIFGALFLLLMGILIGNRSRASWPSSAPGISGDPEIRHGENVVTGGNATAMGGSVNVHLHSVRPAPAVVVSPHATEERPKPNLVCASFKNVSVARGIGDVWSESYVDGALPAGVAVITNRVVDKGVASAREVKAQMIFYDKKGGECFHGTGSWLGHFRNAADFTPGASQKLLLALDNDLESIVAVSNTNERPLPHSARGQIRALESSVPTLEVLNLPVVCDVTLLLTSGAVFGRFVVEIRREGVSLVFSERTSRMA